MFERAVQVRVHDEVAFQIVTMNVSLPHGTYIIY